MTEAVAGNGHVYFAYDASGERTLKYSEHGETVYVDRMYQVETNQAPKLYTKHIFVGETRLISRVGGEGQAYGGQDGEIYYYHPDHLGNTTWVTDNQGAEYEHIEYCPYGESWVNEGRDALNRINHLFTSKELDAETGLYYFDARYLDPKTSRWMSADPAMEEYLPDVEEGEDSLLGIGGVYNTVNLVAYHYGGNNPLKYIDPNGKENDFVQQLKEAGEGTLRGLIKAKDAAVYSFQKAWYEGLRPAGISAGYSFWMAGKGIADGVTRAIDGIFATNTHQPKKGGAYMELGKAPYQIGHHIPSQKALKDSGILLDKWSGPAIVMDPEDHYRTGSYRGNKAYRDMEAELIKSGHFIEAVALGIQDIRSKFGSKYDGAIKEMIEYIISLPEEFYTPLKQIEPPKNETNGGSSGGGGASVDLN